MTQQKYLFPAEQITKRDWFVEIQKPLNITVADIRRDFTKFIKDFPVDIIPHTSNEELQERNRKHKATMLAAIRRNPKNANHRHSNGDLTDADSTFAGTADGNGRTKDRMRPGTQPKNFSQSLHYATQ